MTKIVEIQFDIGDEVYLRADPDQRIRFITGIMLRPTGIFYEATGFDAKWAYDFELSRERNVITATTN